MADYTYKYMANIPVQGRTDGTGYVTFDLTAVYKIQGDPDENLIPVPGRHSSPSMPAVDLQNILDDTGLTVPQKVAAIKNLLETALTTTLPLVPEGWDEASLDLVVQANDLAAATAENFNEFVTVTLNKPYPVTFQL